jgi:threonine aldolase
MLGGGMRQAGVVAAAGIVALDEMVDRLADDHANARRFAGGLAELPGQDLEAMPQTNIVLFTVTDPRFTWSTLIDAALARGVALYPFGHGRIRAATHSGVGPDDIDRALEILAKVMA